MNRHKYLAAFVFAVFLAAFACSPANAEETEITEREAEEYIFCVDTLEEAEEVARSYDAELVSFGYGVGVLRMKPDTDHADAVEYNIKQEEELKEEELKEENAAETRVALYPQIYYTIDAETYEDSGSVLSQWHLDAVKVSRAWEYTKGKGVTVAVIDTGVDLKHSDLDGSVSDAVSVIPDSAYESGGEIEFDSAYKGPQDYFGHGTHVAGIISARDDDDGCIGIAPESKILSIKALEKLGKKGVGAESWLIAAINYAVEQNVDVINMSLGGSITENEPLHEAVRNAASHGIIVVCAAGNISGDNARVFYPAAYGETISVAALKQDGDGVTVDTSYSNHGSFVDIAAPGTSILSTVISGWGRKSGTSMACPIVAGAAALLLSENPYLTSEDVKNLLYESAVDMGDEGRDDRYGYGALDLEAAFNLYQEEYGTLSPRLEIPNNSKVGAGFPVKVSTDAENSRIVFTTDGTEPVSDSPQYPGEGYIASTDSGKLDMRIRVISDGGKMGKIVNVSYEIVPVQYTEVLQKADLTEEVIPYYGAGTDDRFGKRCKKYKLEIPAKQQIRLSGSGNGFTIRIDLYDNDGSTGKLLVSSKSGKAVKWKNTSKETVTAWAYVSYEGDEAYSEDLTYSFGWNISKINVAGDEADNSDGEDENDQEHGSSQESGSADSGDNAGQGETPGTNVQQQITSEPAQIPPDNTEWFYTMDTQPDHKTDDTAEIKLQPEVTKETVAGPRTQGDEVIITGEIVGPEEESNTAEVSETVKESEMQDTELATDLSLTENRQDPETDRINDEESGTETDAANRTKSMLPVAVLSCIIILLLLLAILLYYYGKKNEEKG